MDQHSRWNYKEALQVQRRPLIPRAQPLNHQNRVRRENLAPEVDREGGQSGSLEGHAGIDEAHEDCENSVQRDHPRVVRPEGLARVWERPVDLDGRFEHVAPAIFAGEGEDGEVAEGRDGKEDDGGEDEPGHGGLRPGGPEGGRLMCRRAVKRRERTLDQWCQLDLSECLGPACFIDQLSRLSLWGISGDRKEKGISANDVAA